MEYQTIQAEARTDRGKGAARRTRTTGRIPAIAYGGGADAVALSLNPKDLRLLHKGELGWNTPFHLAVEGGDDLGLSMLKAVQKHPLSGELLHADFIRVQEDTPVTVKVPVRLTGKAPGVELGGKLAQPLRDVYIACLPSAIPAAVVVDVSQMGVGDKVLLSSLPSTDGVTVLYRHDATVVNVVRGRVAKAATTVAEG